MDVVMADPSAEVEAMSGGELLDHAGDLATVRNRCEVQILKVAVQHANLNSPQTLDPAQTRRPGREQARRIGGAGTPWVTEFAAADLGARLGISTLSARMLMADGLDLVHRFPHLWQRVLEGEVRVHLARLVTFRSRNLSAEQAGYVDERVAEYADGRLPYSRFHELVEGLVAAADPQARAEDERQAAARQFARPTRDHPLAAEHGLRGFYIKAPVATIVVFDAALQRIADILKDLGDTSDLDERRVKALLILSRPDLAAQLLSAYQAWRDRAEDPPDLPPDPDPDQVDGSRCGPKPELDWKQLLPHAVIYLHTYAGSDADPVARVEGVGPMTHTWVKHHLSPHAKVTVRPVLDIDGLAPVDAYEIPERHRRAVRLMTPADTFPYSTSLNPTQIDHTQPFIHGPDAVGAGQSRLGNYGPMSTPHHRLKTHASWRVKQPFPGIYLWRDRYGATYLVDHTGTRALRR